MEKRTRDFSALTAELTEIFGRGVSAPLPEERFRELALRVFRHQVRANPTYAAFVRRRGVEPDGVERWEEIPPVPARAFAAVPLVSGDRAGVERIFRTSGTTRGGGARGEHHVLSLALYRRSLLPNFRAHLLPEGERLPLLSLIPAPEAVPDSSLSWMMGVVRDELARPDGTRFLARSSGDLPLGEAVAALSASASSGGPLLLAGTAFAFVHLVDELRRRDVRIPLPPGSRIMETGGFKGRSRTVSRAELYGMIREWLDVAPERVVNEYGMTELLSQFYEPVLHESPGTVRRLVGPPWVRTRVLEPSTLEPVEPGREGLLCHLDLANVGSVAAVLTEDLGVATGEVSGSGFLVRGRAAGAELRGCSLAMEDLLPGAGGGS